MAYIPLIEEHGLSMRKKEVIEWIMKIHDLVDRQGDENTTFDISITVHQWIDEGN